MKDWAFDEIFWSWESLYLNSFREMIYHCLCLSSFNHLALKIFVKNLAKQFKVNLISFFLLQKESNQIMKETMLPTHMMKMVGKFVIIL